MYTIKLVEEKDLKTLAQVMAKSFTVADPEKPWDEDHALAYLQYWIKKQPDMFFGAYTEDGTPVGGMATNIKPWRTSMRCTDAGLFVDVNHQGKGVGKLLFKKVLTEAMEKYDAQGFEGITFAAEQFPLTWYRKIGFAPDPYAVFIYGKCKEMLEKLG